MTHNNLLLSAIMSGQLDNKWANSIVWQSSRSQKETQ
jgi:hypothetical protein